MSHLGTDRETERFSRSLAKASAERQLPLRLHIALFQFLLIREIRFTLFFLLSEHDHIPTVMLAVVALGLTAAVKKIQKLCPVLRRNGKALFSLARIKIQILSPNRDHPRRVSRTLHTPLDFQAVYAACGEHRNQIQAAQILTAQQQTLLRGLFPVPHQTVRQTAGLCTAPAVSGSAAEQTRHKTLAGISITKCTVYKTLHLESCLLLDAYQLFQTEFPRRNHTAHPETPEKSRRLRSRNGGLGACMKGKKRELPMQNSQGSQVLYDCRIQSRFIIRRNILRQRL